MAGDEGVLNTLVAIGSLVIGWFLKVLSDRWSERSTFDHRLRLEKEYGLYCDLWDKLFELRRAAGQLVESLSNSSAVRHDKDFIALFNAYQSVVSKGEPFMSTTVFRPARRILTLAREISGNIESQESLSHPSARGAGSEWLATERERLDQKNSAAFTEIDRLFQDVATAIRQRISP
jgi:hypothetical protein